jgi:hypothetical protein
MPVIIGVNPVRGRKKSAKKKPAKRKPRRNPTKSKGKAAMAKKKTRKKSGAGKTVYRTRTKQVIRYRSRPKKAAKRVSRRKGTTADALNLAKIFRASGAVALGMIVSKVAVNKLTEGGSEKAAWSWPNIMMAAGSSVVAAFILGAFGFKKPTVALVAVGGVGLALYKAFTCKVAPKWGWTESWFGEDEHPYIPYGADDDLEVVDFEPAVSGYGATDGGGRLVASNPYMGATGGGGQLVEANPYMSGNEYQNIAARSRMAYSGGMMG